ncbi:HAD family hydrolase [Albidovulum sediminicola]|uniref:phosphoglycolate phosphatase n=1 Tax=Albidovulum sediminicola TaxID=2984331 RepID=A0ABT2YXG1_9RHOB|nr:HAD family hydrolase [Defluviimonas sp. WL0075]MCV2863561.1 HAD family hydrolase [Defluviimonas sp. WL0075]
MRAIRGLVFDKDGTLFDFRATWGAWTRALLLELTQGEDARAAAVGRVIGYDLASGDFAPDSYVIAHTPEEIADRMIPHLPGVERAALVARMSSLATETALVAATDLPPLFAALKGAGLYVGLATNDFAAPAEAHLRQAGVRQFFDFVAGFDSGHGAKPAPGPLLAFAASGGLDPAEVAMVGDSVHDLVAGRAAGMRTVGVLTGIALAAELAPHADVVLPHIGHLPDWVASVHEAAEVR